MEVKMKIKKEISQHMLHRICINTVLSACYTIIPLECHSCHGVQSLDTMSYFPIADECKTSYVPCVWTVAITSDIVGISVSFQCVRIVSLVASIM